jgi:hypothetical protein
MDQRATRQRLGLKKKRWPGTDDGRAELVGSMSGPLGEGSREQSEGAAPEGHGCITGQREHDAGPPARTDAP